MIDKKLVAQAEIKATGKTWCSGCWMTRPHEGGKKKNIHRWICARCIEKDKERMRQRLI